jgi:hypothetical protein
MDPQTERELDATYAQKVDELTSFEKGRKREDHGKTHHYEGPGSDRYYSPSDSEPKRNEGRDKKEGNPQKGRPEDSPEDSEDSLGRRDPLPVKRDNWREDRKRASSNPDPTPSSSESEGSESDSEESKGKKEYRRSERVFERSFRKMANVLQLTATKSREKEKKRSSVFSAWTDEEQTLLRLLSSDGFRERRLPELTKFTKKMTADKKATKAIQMIFIMSWCSTTIMRLRKEG